MTLTEIQNNFKVWREYRKHPKEKIPDELWQQVASIYSSYPTTIICRLLGLSRQTLKKAMQGDGFATYAPSGHSSKLRNSCRLGLGPTKALFQARSQCWAKAQPTI